MQVIRRSFAALAVSAILPTVVLSAVQVTLTLSEQRREMQRALVERAEKITLLADAELQSDISALRALSAARSLDAGEISQFAERARNAFALEPSWRSIRIEDARTSRTLALVASDPAATPQSFTVPPTADKRAIKLALSPDGHTIYLSVVAPRDQPRYVLSLAKDSSYFQALLKQNVRAEPLAAIITSDGRFLARVGRREDKRGALASASLRGALERAPAGVYRGVSLEGMQNYTAYWTSPTTMLSTHIAVPTWSFDGPRLGSALVAIAAATLTMAFIGVLATLILRDLTERRAVEAALNQAQKMEMVGRMAGGVAHDFANLVAAFGSGVRMLSRETLSPRAQTIVRELDDAVERARALSRRLLDFSRVQDVDIEPVDVGEVMNGVLGLLRHTVGPKVDLNVDVDADVGRALTNAQQLELALLNLAANARDAMPEGGALTVRAGVAPTKQPMIDIIVADTGHGMSQEVLQRAQEPFFTTKPAGQGTGLGLAQVFGLARRSKGDVDIQSAEGTGTRIRIRLPRVLP